MEQPLLSAEGIQKTVHLFNDRVKIDWNKTNNPRIICMKLAGSELFLKDIVGILYQPPEGCSYGYIHFVMVGDPELVRSVFLTSPKANNVTFSRSQLLPFDQLRIKIQSIITKNTPVLERD